MQNAPAVVCEFGIAIPEWAREHNFEASLEFTPDCVIVAKSIEIEVAPRLGVGVFFDITQNVLEQELAELALFGAGRHRDALDLAPDVSFFVCQEEVEIPVSSDEGLPFESGKRFFDRFSEC